MEGAPADRCLDFARIYNDWFEQVARWTFALGGPSADVEDLAQEVFVVVRRKLPGFDGRNLPGWLYRIAQRTVSDQRRRAWFRNLVRRRSALPIERLVSVEKDPRQRLEEKEARHLVHELLAGLSADHRVAFLLFEVEGYSGEEIATLQGVPPATVWTRLHRARKGFFVALAARKLEGRL